MASDCKMQSMHNPSYKNIHIVLEYIHYNFLIFQKVILVSSILLPATTVHLLFKVTTFLKYYILVYFTNQILLNFFFLCNWMA